MTTRIMNGGSQARYGVRMRPDDVITQGPNKLVDYQERQTGLGLTLMTVSECLWTNQAGQMVKTMQTTDIRY
jgi:N-terminal half of MaoC dehydratase